MCIRDSSPFCPNLANYFACVQPALQIGQFICSQMGKKSNPNRSRLVPKRWQWKFIPFRQMPLPRKCVCTSKVNCNFFVCRKYIFPIHFQSTIHFRSCNSLTHDPALNQRHIVCKFLIIPYLSISLDPFLWRLRPTLANIRTLNSCHIFWRRFCFIGS